MGTTNEVRMHGYEKKEASEFCETMKEEEYKMRVATANLYRKGPRAFRAR